MKNNLPKKDYLGSMRQRNWSGFASRLGHGLNVVGKELTRPGASPKQVMAPFGKVYDLYRSHLSEPSAKVARWFSTAKISKMRKETMEQRIKNLGPTVVESAKNRDIVEEELDPMEAQMAKEIGEYSAGRIMKRVRALFPRPGSGVRVKKERVAQEIRRTGGVDKERIEFGVAVSDSHAPQFEEPRERGATQPEVAEEFAEAEKLGIVNKQEVKEGEKRLGAEYFEKTQAPFHETHRPESVMNTFMKRFGGSRATKDNK